MLWRGAPSSRRNAVPNPNALRIKSWYLEFRTHGGGSLLFTSKGDVRSNAPAFPCGTARRERLGSSSCGRLHGRASRRQMSEWMGMGRLRQGRVRQVASPDRHTRATAFRMGAGSEEVGDSCRNLQQAKRTGRRKIPGLNAHHLNKEGAVRRVCYQ